jgi:DNA-binding MarR family transcriptional regulator
MPIFQLNITDTELPSLMVLREEFGESDLRWFTLRSVKELAERSWLKVAKIKRNYRLLKKAGGNLNRIARGLKYFPFKNLFTFQYVVLLGRNS